MADLLIKGMNLPKEDRVALIAVFSSGDVKYIDRETFNSFYLPQKAQELPPHGRLGDIDKMIAECREKPFPVYISSSEELADVLEEYVNLDKIGHTVIVPASEETDKDCESCFWYQQRGCQFQCVHEHGECNGERFEQAEP